VVRALVTGPARRRPARVVLPVLGVAIGVAAAAAIHHANDSVTASFREAADAVAGRTDFVVTGAAGIPVADLESLAFLWRMGSFAPAVTGTAILQDGSNEVLQVLGIDWGGDSAVRDIRLIAAPGPSAGTAGTAGTAGRRLLSGDAVLVPEPLARRHGLAPGSVLSFVRRVEPRSPAFSSSRAWRAPRAGTS
jgi:hypothetical protein